MQKALAKLQKIDYRWQTAAIPRGIYAALDSTTPLIAISVTLNWLTAVLIGPNSLVHLPIAHTVRQSLPGLAVITLENVLLVINISIVCVLVARIVRNYLTWRTPLHAQATLPVLLGVGGCLLFFANHQTIPTISADHYLVFVVFACLVGEFSYHYQRSRRQKSWRAKGRQLLVMLLFGMVVVSLKLLLQNNLPQWLFSNCITDPFFNRIVGVSCCAVVGSLLYWLGIPLPVELVSTDSTLNVITSNLAVRLHDASATLPYPINLYSVYIMFGLIGGPLVLTLFFLRSRFKSRQRVGRWALFPVLFGNYHFMLLGGPLFLRPLYVFPLVACPLLNCLCAGAAIRWHLIPVPVYQIPAKTPPLLQSFLASNCDWRCLLLSLSLLVLNGFIFWPFFKCDDHTRRLERTL